jgi:hypothetical protein
MYYLIRYLFTVSYWTAYELGERDKPEINAEYFVFIIAMINSFGIMEILMYLGFSIKTWMICVFFFMLYLAFHKLLMSKSRYKKIVKEFDYLKDRKYLVKRRLIMVVISLWSIAFFAFGGMIR